MSVEMEEMDLNVALGWVKFATETGGKERFHRFMRAVVGQFMGASHDVTVIFTVYLSPPTTLVGHFNALFKGLGDILEASDLPGTLKGVGAFHKNFSVEGTFRGGRESKCFRIEPEHFSVLQAVWVERGNFDLLLDLEVCQYCNLSEQAQECAFRAWRQVFNLAFPLIQQGLAEARRLDAMAAKAALEYFKESLRIVNMEESLIDSICARPEKERAGKLVEWMLTQSFATGTMPDPMAPEELVPLAPKTRKEGAAAASEPSEDDWGTPALPDVSVEPTEQGAPAAKTEAA